MTGAAWMRDFILHHPDYKHDSVMSERINYDLLQRIVQLTTDPDPRML